MTGLATPLAHLAVPLALSVALGPDIVPPGLMALALVCAVLPDLDALGLWLGIPYDHPFGHRGITHSLPFAVALADVERCLSISPHAPDSRQLRWTASALRERVDTLN